MKYNDGYYIGGLVRWKGRLRKIVDHCPPCKMLWVKVLGKKELIRYRQLK